MTRSQLWLGFGEGDNRRDGSEPPHLMEHHGCCGALNTTGFGMLVVSRNEEMEGFERKGGPGLRWALTVENPELQPVRPLQWMELAQGWWVPVPLLFRTGSSSLVGGCLVWGLRILLPGTVRLWTL